MHPKTCWSRGEELRFSRFSARLSSNASLQRVNVFSRASVLDLFFFLREDRDHPGIADQDTEIVPSVIASQRVNLMFPR